MTPQEILRMKTLMAQLNPQGGGTAVQEPPLPEGQLPEQIKPQGQLETIPNDARLQQQAPPPVNPLVEQIRRLRGQADQLEQQAQPQQVQPQGLKQNVVAGILGATTPGGYSQMMAQRHGMERQRQQDTYGRMAQLRGQASKDEEGLRNEQNAMRDQSNADRTYGLNKLNTDSLVADRNKPKFSAAAATSNIFDDSTGKISTPGVPVGDTSVTPFDQWRKENPTLPVSKWVELNKPQNAGATDNQLVAIVGPDGNPVLVPRAQAVGKRPASTRDQGRQVISGDAGRIADFDTSLNDLATLRKEIPAGATGTRAKVGAMLPNAVTDFTGWGVEAKQKQAVIDRVKQVIGKTLEGGVLRQEDEKKYERILPTIADTAAVVTKKLDGLEKAITQRRVTLMDSLEDAGYDVGRYRDRQPTAPAPTGGGGSTLGAPAGGNQQPPTMKLPDGTVLTLQPNGKYK